MKSLEFEDRDAFDVFREEKKAEMHETIWKAIDRAVALNESTAYIFEIYLRKEKIYIDIMSESEEWLHTLELAMKWYISTEEYEICQQIRVLMNKIEKLQQQ